jgi:nucleoside 2-deoxyribosyltransferase
VKLYLAAAYHRKDEMKALAVRIEAFGHTVTSRWLEEEAMPIDPMEQLLFLRSTATMDFDDVRSADMLVRFTDDLSTSTVPSVWCTGSRMEETGYAYALGKDIVIVGGMQSIFDRLESRLHLRNEAALLHFLKDLVEAK